MAQTDLPFDHLDDGDATIYVDQRIFGESLDDLDSHIRRKKALAERTRYSVLYLLYEYGEMSRKRLSEETGRTSNKLQQPLRTLKDVNLIEKIPGPKGADQRKTYYRITTLGRQEIESDLRNILGEHKSERRYKLLGDPELVNHMAADSGRLRHGSIAIKTDSAEFQSMQQELKQQHDSFKRTEAPEDR